MNTFSTLATLSLIAAPLVRAAPFANRTVRDLPKRTINIEWTAWGDSYASGVGAGRYLEGRRCLRYEEAYPVWLNDDPDNILTPGENNKFNNVVCSGAKAEEVEEFQFYTEDQGSGQPNWQYYPRKASGKPTIGTLTVGGDDIDFPGILSNCIVEGFPWPLSSGFTPRSCDDQRALSWSLISSGDQDTPNGDLVGKIDSLIKKIIDYGRGATGDGFRLYVTGYGQFFNDQDPGCNTVTFARSANPNPDGKDHVMMTTELRADFNHMSRTLNKAIQQAVDQNSGSNVKYIDIDGMLDGHRFCEAGIQEPDQNNGNLWFFHYPYNTNDDNAQIDYLNSVAEANKDSLTWDPKSTLYVDYVNQFWTKVDENSLMQSVGATAEDDANFYNFWSDTIGYRAKIFHPQLNFGHEIYKAIANQYKSDIAGDQPPPDDSQPPPPDYATGTCHLHVNEYENCNDDSSNLSAEIVIWDNAGNEIGRTAADGDGNFPGINDGASLRMKSKLPADLVVTGEHQNDYIQFTLETNPQLSWTSRDEQKDHPDAYCHNGGWDPRDGPDCPSGAFGDPGATAKNQVDCWFKC